MGKANGGRGLEPGLHGQFVHSCKKMGDATGPNPTDRGKSGSKRHVVTDRQGIPLTAQFSGANVHDSRMLEPLLDALSAIRGKRGRPKHRPAKLHAYKGYDCRRYRAACTHRSIRRRIARFRRLVVRYERRADIHLALPDDICVTSEALLGPTQN
jgi:transposase